MLDIKALTTPPADYAPEAITLPPIKIGTLLEDWEQQRAEIHSRWLDFLGHGPAVVPLEPEILAEEDLGDCYRNLVSYQVEDGCRVEAYLMGPKTKGPYPAVVVFHPTTNITIRQAVGFGTRPPLQCGINLARRGYVTLTPRNYIWDYRGHTAEKWEQYAWNAQLVREMWPEWSGMGKMVWDGMRAVDYLLTIAGVDGERIGCIGHSLGAKEVLYSMAFDERMRAGISSEGGVGKSFSNWDAPWYLGECIHEREDIDHHQLLALAAPRALLVFGGGKLPSRRQEGKSPGADTLETWNYIEAARPAYQLYGASDALGYRLHDEGHWFPYSDEDMIYEWFAHYIL